MSGAAGPNLRRVLSFWDLIFYGIVLIQPIAPVGIFGIVSRISRAGHREMAHVARPSISGLGFLFCLGIWLSLPVPAKIAGGVWFAAGVAHAALRTRGFRAQPAAVDFSEG